MSSLFMFFFFQAEDGIRDDLVTGVQTCALPILDAFWTRWHQLFCLPTLKQRRKSHCHEVWLYGSGRVARSEFPLRKWRDWQDRKSGVEGKRVDFGGGRVI